MLTNYLKVALRSLYKHKLFSFINVFGLALSLSFCLLVIMIAQDQTSFDRFHPSPEDVYRINTIAHRKSGSTEPYASSAKSLGMVVRESSPAVVEAVTMTSLRGEAVVGENRIRVEGFLTENSFFDVFGFQFSEGSRSTAFHSPQSIVLSAQAAGKLFGSEPAVGKTLKIGEYGDFTIQGVLSPPAGKTHLEFDFLGSSSLIPLLEKENKIFPVTNNWKNYYSSYNYVRLHEGNGPEELLPVLATIPGTYFGDLELETRDAAYSFELQRLTEITPGPVLSNNLGSGMPEDVLFMLGVLAGIGMIAAMFNYTSLTLAKSLSRAKEVGIRKVSGAGRGQLFTQFLVESVVALFLALVVGESVLRFALIPGFKSLQMTAGMNIDFIFTVQTYLVFVAAALTAGVLAGAFLAVVLSGFRPALVLKSVSGLHVFSRVTLRKILLVFQFILSLVLIIVLITIYEQFKYALDVDYGFNRKNIVSMNLQGNDVDIVMQKLAQHPEVEDYTAVSHHMGTWEDSSVDVRVQAGAEKTPGIRDYSVDDRYIRNLGLHLVAGTDFSPDTPGLNKNQIIVNEKFVEQFGLGTPADAVGKTVILEGDQTVTIRGVLKNFLFKPLVYQLQPMMLTYDPGSWRHVLVTINGNDPSAAVASFQKAWKEVDPSHPFEFEFFDDKLRHVYDFFSDMVLMIGFLALMALTISLLGLLGIVTFNAEARTKEIGIRKVLGSTVRQIVFLFARQELLLMGIAAVIAVPLSMILGGWLLNSFAHKIDIGIMIVGGGMLIVFALAGLIIALRALRSASANPVEALRYE
ncbi:MAG: ABC transporter permease [Bacteroidota bacterium]